MGLALHTDTDFVAAVLEQGVLAGLGQVVGNHLIAHLLRSNFGHPAQFLFGFAGVIEHGFDNDVAEAAGGGADFSLVFLEHKPLHAHAFFGVALLKRLKHNSRTNYAVVAGNVDLESGCAFHCQRRFFNLLDESRYNPVQASEAQTNVSDLAILKEHDFAITLKKNFMIIP